MPNPSGQLSQPHRTSWVNLVNRVRAAIADDFWDGEPARALLGMHTSATLGVLLGPLFELAHELDVGEDDTMVAPSLAPDAIVRATPDAVLAVMQSRFGEAVSAVLDGEK